MTEILSRLKELIFDNKESSIPEIKYIQNSEIILTLNRGFTELYRTKPKNPILFLSKWLSRESKAKELEKKYKENKLKKENLELKYYQIEKNNFIQKEREGQERKVKKEDEDSLIQEIKDCKDFWLGFNHICERLKTLTNSTGCYIGIYDQKRKAVKEEDDIDGHLDPSGVKVLRYIGWNNDHEFLNGKFLEPNQGVTYDLINVQPPQQTNEQPQNPPNDKKPEEEKDKKKSEEELNTLLIKDVVNDNRIKFFREPRLGCYLALDLTYKTSLSYNSLLSAIRCTKNYEGSKEEEETRKKEWKEKQEEIQGQINELKELKAKEEELRKLAEERALEAEIKAKMASTNENEGNKPPEEKKENVQAQQQPNQQQNQNKKDQILEYTEEIEALEKQLTEWTEEEVKLEDYEKGENHIYMCLDTLGQDRVFSEKEIEYIKLIGKNIKNSIEKLEQSLLEKDRDLRIKFLEKELKLKEEERYCDEKFEDDMNNHMNQYFNSEEFKSKGIADEKTKNFEGEIFKINYLKDLLLGGDCGEILLTFQNFEFVEFIKIFQNLFYFARINPLDINEIKTNKLEWKRARNYWKDLFPYVKEYSPIGPKPEIIKPIYKLNKIKDNLESCIVKKDDIKAYSQTLLMFVDFILQLIRVRHDDIIERICKVAVYKDKRERIIKTNQEIDEERKKIIDAAKEQNPNVRVPGEEVPKEEKKEEGEEKEGEKKVEGEEKKENPEGENKENKESKKEESNKENSENSKENKKENESKELKTEGGNKENKDSKESKESEEKEIEEKNKTDLDSMKLEEDLKKFDEENPKQEIPPDIEYDVDNDYDIDNTERETAVNNALQEANTVAVNQDNNNKKIPGNNPTNQNQQGVNNNMNNNNINNTSKNVK